MVGSYHVQQAGTTNKFNHAPKLVFAAGAAKLNPVPDDAGLAPNSPPESVGWAAGCPAPNMKPDWVVVVG